MFAAYATTRERGLVDRELYLPKSWTDDRDRCHAAHIPEQWTFATKPDLAKAVVLRAIASPLPIAWVTADAAYGQEWRLRRMISKPKEIACYLAYAPLGATVEHLIPVAGMHWVIEEAFQAAKNECGFDQYEVRRYTGSMLHITLAVLAHAFLAVMAADAAAKGAAQTVPASRPSPWQKFGGSWQLATHPSPLSSARALRWSHWRRRRQAVARRCHYQRRLHTIEGAAWERAHGPATSPLHTPKPHLNSENVKVLLEY